MIDLCLVFLIPLLILPQIETTSVARSPRPRSRLPFNDVDVIVTSIRAKRQAMGNAAGGTQMPMQQVQSTASQAVLPSSPHGHGMAGSPQFMGPHGAHGIHHEFSCMGRLPRLYQDPWLCNRYYWCNYGGPAVPFSCPGGQLFDQELQSCTMALAVECRDFPEPMDATDMAASGMGYGGHFGGSPYGMGGMGMSSMNTVNVAGSGGLGPSISGPMTNYNVMLSQQQQQPPPPPSPLNNAPVSVNHNSLQPVPGGLPTQVVMSSPMNNGQMGITGMTMAGSGVMPTMTGMNGIPQAASLQGSIGSQLSNNINLNQFANALLSAGHSQSGHAQTPSRILTNSVPDISTGCESGKLGLFADIGKHCRTYFFCSPGGTKYEFQCTAPLLFSDRIKTCDNAENVICESPGHGGNQVVNGYAMNGQPRGLGFAGLANSAPPDEALPLRFAFQQDNGSPAFNSQQQNLYAGPGMKRHQMVMASSGGGMPPEYSQGTAQPQYYQSFGPRSGGNIGRQSADGLGSNPFSMHPMYGQASFATNGGQRGSHQFQPRSLPPTGVPAYYVPPATSYPPYQAHSDPIFNYQSNVPPPSSYPSPMYSRPVLNSAAEPQMDGTMPHYQTHVPNPSFYPIGDPNQRPSYHLPPQVPSHYGSNRGMMGTPQHGGGGAGPRGGMRLPLYDPDAEVEAGRGPEPGVTGSMGPAGVGGGQGVSGSGQPAGLNSYPQTQIGPMMMPPLDVESSAKEVAAASTSATDGTASTTAIVTTATLRPMSPDILRYRHEKDLATTLTQRNEAEERPSKLKLDVILLDAAAVKNSSLLKNRVPINGGS